MGRGRDGRRESLVHVGVESGMGRLAERAVSKLAPLTPPWLLLGLAPAAAAVGHHLWAGTPLLPWVSAAMSAGTCVLTGLTWLVAHGRQSIGRNHATVSTAAAGAWLTTAVITGPTQQITGTVLLTAGSALCLAWNIRQVIRVVDADSGSDGLRSLFGHGAKAAGLDGATARTIVAGDAKVTGAVALPGGSTADDLIKRLGALESAMGLPPGSVSADRDPDHAARARITVSDPRVMKRPIRWPGPSRVGGSISEPLRIGLWQDQDPAEATILGHHLQVMGMSGSGKSFGAAFNLLGEIITRVDVAVLAIDVTKGRQTLGALAPALHAFETDGDRAKALFARLAAQVKPRTDYLADKGLSKWAPGCGLAYLILWVEEAPDFFGLTDRDALKAFVKAARSAGISIVFSLQRSDWAEMPTIVRGQLAKMCFGVGDSGDADFGLSERQVKAGADPAQWAQRDPGMAYLDAPGIASARVAMPLRTYWWGSDAEAIPAMREHAAHCPTTRVPTDWSLQAICGTTTHSRATNTIHSSDTMPTARATSDSTTGDSTTGDSTTGDSGSDEEIEVMLEEREPLPGALHGLSPVDPDADVDIDPDADIDTSGPAWAFPAAGGRLDPATARGQLRAHLDSLTADGQHTVTARQLLPIATSAGYSRPWLHKVLGELAETGVITKDDSDDAPAGNWIILSTTPSNRTTDTEDEPDARAAAA